MKVTMRYEKINTYAGKQYLHGWEEPYSTKARWFNASLQRYDKELPFLLPGMVLSFECESVGESFPFATVIIIGDIKLIPGK